MSLGVGGNGGSTMEFKGIHHMMNLFQQDFYFIYLFACQ